MPRIASGSAYESRGSWFARVTLDKRIQVKLPTCSTAEQAEARKDILAALAKDMRRKCLTGSSGRLLLKTVAVAADDDLPDAVGAVQRTEPDRRECGIRAAAKWWKAPIQNDARQLSDLAELKTVDPPSSGGVYFIESNGRIKIGYSGNVRVRFNKLSGACPGSPRLLLVERGGYDEERALHLIFKPLRVRREWFHAKGALVQFILERRAGDSHG